MFLGDRKARKPITLLVKVVQENGETQEEYLILEANTRLKDTVQIAISKLKQLEKINIDKEEGVETKGKPQTCPIRFVLLKCTL